MGVLNVNKGILLQQAGHQPGSGQVLRHPSDPQGLQAVMRTPEGVGLALVDCMVNVTVVPKELHHQDTYKDLLDIEAFRVQALKDVEARIPMEIHKRKRENSGSGSFQSALGEVGVGQGSKTPVDPTLGQLVTPPGLPASDSS